ncbi:MAG: tRNA-specific adenosine deaminase, partial [Sporomusaceae bacterium]|nr:tRNA-specific adenosine deaminase [Sporomusaceae bacterium]
MNDFYYMGLALDEARKAYDLGEIPIGAVLVVDDQ